MTALDSRNWGLTPAMETGLFQKPQDRIFIIELENSIVSFINSNTESFQLRPMNSYYRLLSHQIAEYHNLNHVLARTQDSCVILFKGENFQKIEGRHLKSCTNKNRKSSHPVRVLRNRTLTEGFGPKVEKRVGKSVIVNRCNNATTTAI
ncbi:ANL_HP_G0186950.mRNA.1.CDS.1 [Saccharomyces cerevisiae]|nr:ANL_HP_G0186950.mRNA.1.CDS.1 [Saccharomyces cerevisiae]CAI6391368.1 ANL_HP_G0186950.mRNA.1.CDS.1 [Saccharomyces cerevisiae]